MTQLKVAEARKAKGCEGAGLVIRTWLGNQACFFSTRIPLLTLRAPSYRDGKTEGGSDMGADEFRPKRKPPFSEKCLVSWRVKPANWYAPGGAETETLWP